jgi:hypothetical protein
MLPTALVSLKFVLVLPPPQPLAVFRFPPVLLMPTAQARLCCLSAKALAMWVEMCSSLLALLLPQPVAVWFYPLERVDLLLAVAL